MACEWTRCVWEVKKGNIWRREWDKDGQPFEHPTLSRKSNWSQSIVLLCFLFLFLLGPSAIPLIRGPARCSLNRQSKLKGLLAISSHPGLCTLSRVALWAVLLTRSPKMLQTRKLFFLLFPAPVPATIYSPMVFLALIILVSIGGPIQIIILASQSGDSIRGGLSSQKLQGRAETSLMAQF